MEFNLHRVGGPELPTRIPVMLKKRARGPYLRKSPPPARPKTNFIREWRESRGLTQSQLADMAGLSSGSAISAYENGENDPSVETLQAIAAALDLTSGMLLDVDPTGDPVLWEGFQRASKDQRREIGRIVGALVGPPKAKK